MERQRDIQNPNNEPCFSLVLSASTPAWVLRGKVSETMLLTSIHEPKVSVSHVASSEWKGRWMGRREGRVPALESVQHGLGTSGTVEWLWGEVQNSCKVPKVMRGKTKKNLSSTYGRSSVMFLYWRKRKIKMGSTSSHLAEPSAVQGGMAGWVWRAEVQKRLHGWAGKLPQWKRLRKHYLINHPPFPSCSVNLAQGLTNSAQSSYGPLQGLDPDVHTAQELSSQKEYF